MHVQADRLMSVGDVSSAVPCAVTSAWQRLSPVQESLWFMQRLAPDSGAWHLARAFHLRGPLDAAALHRALSRVRARQAVLRTRFEEHDGAPDADTLQALLSDLMQ